MRTISQQTAKRLILKHAPSLISKLGLHDWEIEFKVSRKNPPPFAGLTEFIVGKHKATVIIFSSDQLTKNECLSTLFHELLHIRMYDLNLDAEIEENIVSSIEVASLHMRTLIV